MQSPIDTETLEITRIVNATPAKVFQAWIDPAFVSRWFLPNERWTKCEVDIVPELGGNYQITLTHSDGDVYKMGGKIVELVPNERLAYIWEDHNMMMNNTESLVTITIQSKGEGTEFTLIHSKLATPEYKAMVNEGWTGCVDRLVLILAE